MTLTAIMQEDEAACLASESGGKDRAGNRLASKGPGTGGPAGSGASSGQGPSLAGTYLNQFNQMVELIERLPEAPELIDDLLNWQPTSYHDYFAASAMPGRASAADVYAALNRCLRKSFEGMAVDLDLKALGAVAAIRRHYKTHGEARPDIMTGICSRAGTHLREALGRANAFVNHAPGESAPAPKV
jgi:hypothetical protein